MWIRCLDGQKLFYNFFLFKKIPLLTPVENLMNYIILGAESFEYTYTYMRYMRGERRKDEPKKKRRWEKKERRKGEEMTTGSTAFICRWQVNDSTSTKNIVGLFITGGGGPNSSYDTLFINGFAVSGAAGLRLWIMSTANGEWWWDSRRIYSSCK